MTLICGGIKDAQQKNKLITSFINSDGTNVQVLNAINIDPDDECEDESYEDFQLHRTTEREGLISELINEDDLMQE